MENVTRTQAVKNLLLSVAHPDLAELYSSDMEVQVNVAQDEGERITDVFRGKQWQGWTDGLTTWKPFRIPYKANTEPEYDDQPMQFDLAQHAEGIGMTGWDWTGRVSRWVAYDFDAILGHADAHKKKLSDEEMQIVLDKALEIPWVTTRKSTSGSGLHLYVMLEGVETANHNEHAALARSILGVMTAITGYDFSTKVDICGGNMWVWHRKMRGTTGLDLIKQGDVLPNSQIPQNWKDHLKVVQGKATKTMPKRVLDSGNSETFDLLTARKMKIGLDQKHLEHIEWLRENDCVWWWDSDQSMLVTHTAHLAEMHEKLGLIGVFKTETTHSSTHNCFLFPIRNGGWAVRRYSLGVNEATSWEQDGDGWTRCYLNKLPNIETACASLGAVEDTNGEFVFKEAEVAIQAAQQLGIEVVIDPKFILRRATLKKHKDGRLIMTVEKIADDAFTDKMRGWLPKKDKYIRIFSMRQQESTEPECNNHDEMVRHIVTEAGSDSGWLLNIDATWIYEPIQHLKLAMKSHNISSNEIDGSLGSAILNCWTLVNRPFRDEYPGDRVWNRDAAKLAFVPSDYTSDLHYPTWSKIFDHLGTRLTKAVTENPWCKANGIKTGGEYLKCWVASLFQDPERHLPYLFFYSREQNTGKTSFYEALFHLFKNGRGYIKANQALKNKGDFNGEIIGNVLCAIEEEDLGGKKNKGIYDKIKDYVTSKEILIHPKRCTPYMAKNYTHWVQCSNDHKYCPIFPDDTRITMISVASISPMEMIPAGDFDTLLKREAPDFLAEILHLEIPKCSDRLRIPALETAEKTAVQDFNKTDLEMFLSETCEPCDGHAILFAEVFDKFSKWQIANEQQIWSKRKMGQNIPPEYPKGRSSEDGSKTYIGNLKWKSDVNSHGDARRRYTLEGDFLRTSTCSGGTDAT